MHRARSGRGSRRLRSVRAPTSHGSDPAHSPRQHRARDQARLCSAGFAWIAAFQASEQAAILAITDARRRRLSAIRLIKARTSRSVASSRSTYRPTQNRLSAARLGSTPAARCTAIRSGVGKQRGFADRALREHPGVGGRAAALQADGSRVDVLGDAHEPARHHLPVVAVAREKQPQDERIGAEPAVRARPAWSTTSPPPARRNPPRGRRSRASIRSRRSSSSSHAERAFAERRRPGVAKRRRDHHRIEPVDHLVRARPTGRATRSRRWAP